MPSTSPTASQKTKKPKIDAAKPKPKASTSTPKLSEEYVSDSSESEDEDSEEEEEESSEDEVQPTQIKPTKNAPATNYPAYEPPPNFTPISSSDIPPSNPFSAANLKGKELWFVTAPSATPLSKLHHIDPASIIRREPVIQTKHGRNFILKIDDENDSREAQDGGINVLFPDNQGTYRKATQKVARSFRLVEAPPRLPKIEEDSIPQTKAIREQPEGLRMRFMPFGAKEVVEDDVGSNLDVNMMDVDSSPKARRESGGGNEEKKRKRHKANISENGEGKEKKRKAKVS